jgi:hypothetical protein
MRLLPIRVLSSVVALGCATAWSAHSAEPALPEPIPLAGEWDLLPGHDKDDVAADPAKFEGWQKTAVPGIWPDGRLPCAWQVKRFQAPAAAAGLDSEVLFERVHWNAAVWLNGKKLGEWPDGYAPFRLAAAGAMKPGAENVLVVRVGGFAGVPKAKSGWTLFPAGFASSGRGGGGGIMGRVWVRFYRQVRVTRAQAMPDLANKTAKVAVRIEGSAAEAAVELVVVEAESGRESGRAAGIVKIADGIGESVIPVAMRDVKPWEPGKPFLYRLNVAVQAGGQAADTFSERFGMREVATRPDGFYLNGRKLRLFGTNIIGDMGFWRGATNLLAREKIKAVIVDTARGMNAVCIRTHTAPIPQWWLDVCDEEGLLVLLEFPVTVNCGSMGFDEKEAAAFQKNLMDEAAAVLSYMGNHPSIAMWVMTNESNNMHEWERTALWSHFRKVDPTRPAIRASYDTPDARDIHSYAATWKGSDGDFEFRCRKEADRARRDKTPAMITEYLDGTDARVTRKWFGPPADSGDPKVREWLAAAVAEWHASRGMEQTEAARRLGYSCILPFGPGFYGTVGKASPRAIDYAVPCALAPVGVSIDLSNQHFAAGQSCKTAVWLMNDTPAKAAVNLQFAVFDTDPGWDPSAKVPEGVPTQTQTVETEANTTVTRDFQWQVPAKEGKYVLVARIEPPGGQPVISRRTIYSIRREPAPKSLSGKKVLVVESGSRKLSTWIAKQGCSLIEAPQAANPSAPPGQSPAGLSEAQLVVIGPRTATGDVFKALSPQIPGYVQRGGRVVVLEQTDWPKLKDLLGIAVERTDYDYDDNNAPADQRTDSVMASVSQSQASGGSSRVFRWEQPERGIWKGITDEYLWSWNGEHGRVARVSMSALPGRARVLVKYAEAERDDLKFVPVAAVGHVQGEVLYFMLQVDGRYDEADPDFDPVVERLMMNVLEY